MKHYIFRFGGADRGRFLPPRPGPRFSQAWRSSAPSGAASFAARRNDARATRASVFVSRNRSRVQAKEEVVEVEEEEEADATRAQGLLFC